MKPITVIAAAMIIGGLVYYAWPALEPDEQTQSSSLQGGTLADVILPETLSQNAHIGKLAFEAKCAACHGINAAGQDGVAPPLVHLIYEPNHHGDESFQRAAAVGVRARHWPFGDMPPVEGVTRGDVALITAYIRELQRANGIN
jgi:mono/diheme cytochrome c family protein